MKPEEETRSPADPFVQFEVLDRAHSLASMLETLLGQHPGMENGALAGKYDAAGSALAELYAEAGRIVFEENPGTPAA